ncbi:hypothetical protein AGMMS49975_27710 [Clostridia bacterium]|nr:hypothetical protein AGMMS49975_27710 [Clostridia bacterium]
MDMIAEKIVKVSSENKTDSALKTLKSQLKNAEKELSNIQNAIKKGIITDSTKAMLEESEITCANLRVELAKEETKTETKLTKEQIVFWLSQFKLSNSDEDNKRLIDAFVNKVFAYNDKIVIVYNIDDGNAKITLENVDYAIENSLDIKNFTNVKETIKKTVLGTYPTEILEKLGVKKVEKDTFFYETDTEEIKG